MNERQYRNKVKIRAICDLDSMDELTALLNRAYKQHAEHGLLFLASHQDAQTTRQRIGTGRCLVAEIDGKIVGTITYYDPNQSGNCSWARHSRVARIAQLAVDPVLQNRGIGSLLVRHAELCAQEDGATELALDTAESAKCLVAWYRSSGYSAVAYANFTETNYRSIVMSKNLRSAS